MNALTKLALGLMSQITARPPVAKPATTRALPPPVRRYASQMIVCLNRRDTNARNLANVPKLARDRRVEPCVLAHCGIVRAAPYFHGPAHSQEDSMTNRSSALQWVVAVAFGALALVSTARAQSRGELLYSTHCIACHTSQMHWRDRRSATDWQSLKAQVRRWEGAASLDWSEADVLEVTRYLNETIYRFEKKADPQMSKGRAQRPRSLS